MHLDAVARDGHWSSVGGLGTGGISCGSGIGFLAIPLGEKRSFAGKMASECIFEAVERLNRRRLENVELLFETKAAERRMMSG